MKAKFLFIAVLIAFGVKAQTVSDFVSIPNPDDLEVDRFGNLWVNYRVSLSSPEHRLARISPTGIITDVIIENHTLGQFGINDSIIWIAGDWGATSKVYKYDHSGNRLDSISLQYPTSIILDPDGTWYITQNALGRLTKVNPDKTTQILASGSPLNYNLALARDENGMFYTCNLMNALVIKIDPNTGTKTTLVSLPDLQPYDLGFLTYRDGFLYVPSYGSHCIYKVDTAGIGYSIYAGIEGTAGDLNGSADSAKFNTLTAVYFSNSGDTLFVADSKNHKIKMITGINSTTGISEPQKDKTTFEIYPNPAIETLYIELKAKNETIVKIDFITIDGKMMDSIHFSGSENLQQYNLSLERLPKGNYILNITTSKGEVISKKFIKS